MIGLTFSLTLTFMLCHAILITVQKRVYQSFDQNDDMIKVTQQSKRLQAPKLTISISAIFASKHNCLTTKRF